MVIHVQKIEDMKKIYFAPEMEIVDINTNQQLLAGSTNAPVSDETQDNGDALAPEVQEVLWFFDD